MDRISDADGSTQVEQIIPDAALDERLASAYGIFSGKATGEAVLRFTAERARWVAD